MPERPAVRQTVFPAERWFGAEAMAAMLALEQRQVAPDIAAVYGQCGLYMQPSSAGPHALTGHRMHQLLRLHRQDHGLAGDLRCRDEALPVASGTVALAYVQHVLESAADPSALVGELARVLVPEGIAVFVVWHPWRPFRVRWCSRGLHAISATRLSALLLEQGLEVRSMRPIGVCWRAPAASGPDPADAGVPWLAGAYLLVARKRVHGLIPLRTSAQRVALNAGMGAG